MPKRVNVDRQKLKFAVSTCHNEIAAQLDFHPTTLRKKVSGVYPLSLEELNDIADALGRDTTDFLIVEMKPSYDEIDARLLKVAMAKESAGYTLEQCLEHYEQKTGNKIALDELADV
jgi:hypothetical protein